MRGMIPLGVEGWRERQNLGGTELDAEAAALAAFYCDCDLAFSHCPSRSGRGATRTKFRLVSGNRRVDGVAEDDARRFGGKI